MCDFYTKIFAGFCSSFCYSSMCFRIALWSFKVRKKLGQKQKPAFFLEKWICQVSLIWKNLLQTWAAHVSGAVNCIWEIQISALPIYDWIEFILNARFTRFWMCPRAIAQHWPEFRKITMSCHNTHPNYRLSAHSSTYEFSLSSIFLMIFWFKNHTYSIFSPMR